MSIPLSQAFQVRYGLTARIAGVDLAAARKRVEAALAAEGFGVLTEIDVQATLRKKLGVETRPYLILGACNPNLAHRALEREPAIGLLLPCNVVLAQDGPDVIVSAASPGAMFSIVDAAPEISAVAQEAEQRLRRAMESV
jgi:uncharacterized protein (DUF302 family)